MPSFPRLPFQPLAMSPALLAAVSYLARYSGRTHNLKAFQLRRWFSWCEANSLNPPVGIQRAHVELYIRHLGDSGLMDSSVVTMMHGVRGFIRSAHIDGVIAADPAVYARLPKVHRDESRTQGLDRLELIAVPVEVATCSVVVLGRARVGMAVRRIGHSATVATAAFWPSERVGREPRQMRRSRFGHESLTCSKPLWMTARCVGGH